MYDDDVKQRLQNYSRRLFMQRAGVLAGMTALGGGTWLLNPKGAWAADPIKVGIATDLTGPISWGGIPNSQVAKMVVEVRPGCWGDGHRTMRRPWHLLRESAPRVSPSGSRIPFCFAGPSRGAQRSRTPCP